MRPFPRLVLAVALAVAAAVPGPATAGHDAMGRAVYADGVTFTVEEDVARPRFRFEALAMHFQTAVYVADSGAAPYTETQRYVAVCLAQRVGRGLESGCVTTPNGGPVTEGVLPDSATVRVRVPLEQRRGGWIEADVTCTGTGTPDLPPASKELYLHARDVLGVPVPVGGQLGVYAFTSRSCEVAGTIRTDRMRAPVRVRSVADETGGGIFRVAGMWNYAKPEVVLARLREAAAERAGAPAAGV